MAERYLIVSSDCHAGLPCEEYRPFLDAKYLGAFDVSSASVTPAVRRR